MKHVRTVHPGVLTALWLLPLLALLQSALVGHFTIRGIFPSIVLIAVVNWGILRGTDEGVFWGFVGGLCLGFFSGWPFGTCAVAMVVVASVVSLGEGTFIRTHALLPLATVFGATILYYLVSLFVLESTQHAVDWFAALRSIVVPVALYNAVVNVPGYWLSQRLERRVYPMPRANW